MKRFLASGLVALVGIALGGGASRAQTQPAPEPATTPDSLSLHFDLNSTSIRPEDEQLLDQAARLYRDGNPIVMVVTGGTDTTGSPETNLRLSQQRAETVLRGLVARGIPIGRFQIVAKGETDLTVATPDGVAEPRNRRVEITWR